MIEWKILLITVVYFNFCNVAAGDKDTASNVNKLEYWQRDPNLDKDGRRASKKQTRPDNEYEKYRRVFEPVDFANESDIIRSSNQVISEEVNEDKSDKKHEKITSLSSNDIPKQSSVIVWQSYVNKDKLKNTEAVTLKYTSSSIADTQIHEKKRHAGFEHIHFKKISDSELIQRKQKKDKSSNKMKNAYPSEGTKIKEITTKYWKFKKVSESGRSLKKTKEEDNVNTKMNHVHTSEQHKTSEITTKSWKSMNISESERNLKKKKEKDKLYTKIKKLHPSELNKTKKITTQVTTHRMKPVSATAAPADNETPSAGDSTVKVAQPQKEEEKKENLDSSLSPYAIVPQVMEILESFEDTNVTTEVLGRTTEFNDIVLFKISSTKTDNLTRFRTIDMHKYDDTNPEKKIIFIVHGLTVMGINQLGCLTEKEKFRILISYYIEHLDKFDIFLIPMANPDGFVASQPMGRGFWNKNMSPQADCRGVMLDRNFDVEFNNSHDMSSCSQAYPGPTPFSEIETKAISNVFHFNGHRMLAYIHVHAGTYDTSTFKGDAVLYPHGYTDVPGDDDKYLDIKGDIDDSIRNATFRVMTVTVDSLYHWYGKALGTSVDYASKIFGINYAMEFVMQLYKNDMFASEDGELYDYNALTAIWKRVIAIVFRNFAKSVGIIHEDDEK